MEARIQALTLSESKAAEEQIKSQNDIMRLELQVSRAETNAAKAALQEQEQRLRCEKLEEALSVHTSTTEAELHQKYEERMAQMALMSTAESELRQKNEELEAQMANMSTAEAELRQKSEQLEAQVAQMSTTEAELRQKCEKLQQELAEAQKEDENEE